MAKAMATAVPMSLPATTAEAKRIHAITPLTNQIMDVVAVVIVVVVERRCSSLKFCMKITVRSMILVFETMKS